MRFQVLTKAGTAKHSLVDESEEDFKIFLEYEYMTDGPTGFPASVYPVYEDLYKHLPSDEIDKYGVPNVVGEVVK